MEIRAVKGNVQNAKNWKTEAWKTQRVPTAVEPTVAKTDKPKMGTKVRQRQGRQRQSKRQNSRKCNKRDRGKAKKKPKCRQTMLHLQEVGAHSWQLPMKNVRCEGRNGTQPKEWNNHEMNQAPIWSWQRATPYQQSNRAMMSILFCSWLIRVLL